MGPQRPGRSGLTAVLAVLLLVAAPPARAWESAQLRAELDRIMSNYGLMIRPGLAAGGTNEPDRVSVQIHVDRWQQLYDKQQTFGVDGYLRLWWFDQRLSFNASETGTQHLPLSHAQIQQVWVPDLYLEQLIDLKMGEQGKGRGAGFWVYPDGHVFYSRQASIKLACDMQKEINHFPFDSHTCKVRMGFYSHGADQAMLSWKVNDTALPNWDGSKAETACMAAWHVVDMDQSDEVETWPSGDYTFAVATLRFARRNTSYVLSYIVPAILLVSISCLGFWIDPAAVPARVTLGIVTILAVATNYISLHSLLEGAGGDSVWLFRFTFGSYLFNVVAFFELVMVNYGLQAEKWLHAQLERMRAEGEGWIAALERQNQALESLLRQWDTNGDGKITKLELRRGVNALGIGAPAGEINSFFNRISKSGDTATIPEIIQALQRAARPVEAQVTSRGQEKSRRSTILTRMTSNLGDIQRSIKNSVSGRSRETKPPQSPGKFEPSSGKFEPNDVLEVEARAVVRGEQKSESGNTHTHASHALSAQPSPPPSPPEAANKGKTPPIYTTGSSMSEDAGKRQCSRSRISHTLARTLKIDDVEKSQLRDARRSVRRTAAADANAGYLWELKVFWLFPLLAKMRNLDHYARVVLPVAYVCFLIVFFSENDWGRSLDASHTTGSRC